MKHWFYAISLPALTIGFLVLPLACGSPENSGETVSDAGVHEHDSHSREGAAHTHDSHSHDSHTHSDEHKDMPEESTEIATIGEVGSPDVSTGRCGSKMVDEWPLHDKVSTGEVKVTQKDKIWEATIDASAGGSKNARQNPFVYFDLKLGKKVDISDIKALQDSTWDLAFKRVVIRSNSGDSGPGMRSVAKVEKSTLEQIIPPPKDSAYVTDKHLDDKCQLLTDPIQTPLTAFNLLNPNNPSGSQSWYSYGGPGGINPVQGDIYFVRRADGEAFKLQIVSWNSGVFTIRWQPL